MNIINLPLPAGKSWPTLARMRRRALEDWIERAIDLLDHLDGGPDDEDDGSAELSWQHELRGGANVRAA